MKHNRFAVDIEEQSQVQMTKSINADIPNTQGQNFILVEKYLKISDFIEYILDKKEIFLEEQLRNVKNQDDEEQILNKYLIVFLIKTQDCCDFDKTVKFLIEQNKHTMLIDELFEQTDESFKNEDRNKLVTPEKSQKASKVVSAREVKIPPQMENLFRKNARVKFLTQLIN